MFITPSELECSCCQATALHLCTSETHGSKPSVNGKVWEPSQDYGTWILIRKMQEEGIHLQLCFFNLYCSQWGYEYKSQILFKTSIQIQVLFTLQKVGYSICRSSRYFATTVETLIKPLKSWVLAITDVFQRETTLLSAVTANIFHSLTMSTYFLHVSSCLCCPRISISSVDR